MRRLLAAVAASVGYFTTVPIPIDGTRAPAADAVGALPLVGAFVGAASGGLAYGAERLAPSFGPATAYAALALLTGAIHVDGFLDTCDAAFASVAPERRRAILDDPRHGTYAVAGMSVLVAAWRGALGACPPRRRPAALTFACATARLAAVWARVAASPAASVTPSEALCVRPPLAWLVAQTCALAAMAAAIDLRLMLAVPAACGASLALGAWLRARFGGVLSGDAYGFTIAALEPLLVAAVALVRTGPVDGGW